MLDDFDGLTRQATAPLTVKNMTRAATCDLARTSPLVAVAKVDVIVAATASSWWMDTAAAGTVLWRPKEFGKGQSRQGRGGSRN